MPPRDHRLITVDDPTGSQDRGRAKPLRAGLVVLGQVAGAHALRGEVRVHHYGDGANLALVSHVWLADDPDDPSPRRHLVLRRGSGRSGEVRLALEGISDRTAAEEVRGQLVLADPEQLEVLADGEFYWHELVGCDVFDRAGNAIGTVRELRETGAHDLLLVEDEHGDCHLLPTARELMPVIDTAAKRIVVDLPPGMLDAPIARHT